MCAATPPLCDTQNDNLLLPFITTGCVSELGDFAILFFPVQQHWGVCCYRHSAANFKAF